MRFPFTPCLISDSLKHSECHRKEMHIRCFTIASYSCSVFSTPAGLFSLFTLCKVIVSSEGHTEGSSLSTQLKGESRCSDTQPGTDLMMTQWFILSHLEAHKTTANTTVAEFPAQEAGLKLLLCSEVLLRVWLKYTQTKETNTVYTHNRTDENNIWLNWARPPGDEHY